VILNLEEEGTKGSMSKEEAETTTTANSNKNDDNKNDTEIAGIKKALIDMKVDGNKSVWSATLETFGMADGKNKKSDVHVDSIEQGIKILNEYISNKPKKDEMEWMSLVPLAEFKATQDDFVVAFLKWAETTEDKSNNKNKRQFNVSKAHRRLDAYFEWMLSNQKDLENLTFDSIQEAAKIWDIQVTYDKEGHLVWWIDMGGINKEEIKRLEPSKHLQYVTWFSHFVIFDKQAQNNGAMIVEDMGMIGFWKMATLVPAEISAKMDRLTIGILPVRMKQIYIFGAARWMSLLMTILKPFMSKKMRKRMVLLPRKTDMQTFCDDLVTRANIPKDFCGLQGESPRDEHFVKWKK